MNNTPEKLPMPPSPDFKGYSNVKKYQTINYAHPE